MAATPRKSPPDIVIKVTVPAPMAWVLGEVAEKQYGIEDHELALLLIAKGLRKPRGPQTDLTKDWAIYQAWRQRMPVTRIAAVVGVAARTVSTRLSAMGLRSHFEDYRRENASAIAKKGHRTRAERGEDLSATAQKGWETRRALQEQAERAAEQTAEQENGEAERKAEQARAKAAQRKRNWRERQSSEGEGEAA